MTFHAKKWEKDGTSLAVLWLSLCPSNGGGVSLIPGQGAKIPHAVQPKNNNNKKNEMGKRTN